MRSNHLLSICTTIVVCLAGTLLLDRFLPFIYPPSVSPLVVIAHDIDQTVFAIFLVYTIRKKYAFGRYLLYALIYSIVSGVFEAIIGYPPSRLLPHGAFAHDVGISLASMMVYMLFSPPAPEPEQGG